MLGDLVDRFLGRGPPDIGPRSLRRAHACCCGRAGACGRRGTGTSDWASVLATRNSTPPSFASIMLLTALPPAPPTPTTMIFGLRVASVSGTERLIVMGASLLPGHSVPNVAFRPIAFGCVSARFEFRSRLRCFPSAIAPACPGRPVRSAVPRMAISVSPRRCAANRRSPAAVEKAGPAYRIGKPVDGDRTTEPDLLVQNQRRDFRRPGQLACAARKHHAPAGELSHGAGVETGFHLLRRFPPAEAGLFPQSTNGERDWAGCGLPPRPTGRRSTRVRPTAREARSRRAP